jgi:hypothetical protein
MTTIIAPTQDELDDVRGFAPIGGYGRVGTAVGATGTATTSGGSSCPADSAGWGMVVVIGIAIILL